MKCTTALWALVGLARITVADPYDGYHAALDVRGAYEHELYIRGIIDGLYAREHFESLPLAARDLEEVNLEARAQIVFTDPDTLNPKGNGQRAQASRLQRQQWETYVRHWAERNFGPNAYVRIQDVPHDSSSRPDGRTGEARNHLTVEVVDGRVNHDPRKQPGKGVWYHLFVDGGSPSEERLYSHDELVTPLGSRRGSTGSRSSRH